jgi:hypothetical protein
MTAFMVYIETDIGINIRGFYTTRELAEKYIQNLWASNRFTSFYEIEEIIIKDKA